MPAGVSSAEIGKRFGKYELLASLAVGGTAEVYLARIVGEAGFEKYVVVKRLLEHLADDREFVEMFLDEARLGARLDHSNIVQTIELGQVEGRYFIAMEYLAGLSLAQVAGKAQQRVAGGLPLELTLGMIAQAAAGLHYAHERTLPDGTPLKIVHRDVSPQNLVVTFDGEVKIVDFGIAHAALREAHTKSGFIKGKFAYMAPEQCLGKPLDRRTDIFALGVICHELACGRRLFKRESTYATYQAIVKGEVPAPTRVNPRLDPGIDELIMRALAYDPGQRYESSEEFGEAIHAYLHRRGKRVSTGDVGRFLDRYFEPEIGEHAQRMSLLAAGTAMNEPVAPAWDADETNTDTLTEEVDESSATTVDAMPAALPPVPTGPTARAPGEPEYSRLPTMPDQPPSIEIRPSALRPAVLTPPPAPAAAPATVAYRAPTPLPFPVVVPPAPIPIPTPTPIPIVTPAFASGSYTTSDAQRIAAEKQPGEKIWLYPIVFVLAAGVGIGVLLLIDSLR